MSKKNVLDKKDFENEIISHQKNVKDYQNKNE